MYSDSDSSAGFEDVGPRQQEPTPSKYALDNGEVPDVLYVLRHHQFGGRVVEARKSDSPFNDVSSSVPEAKSPRNKTPVIEIITSVSDGTSNHRHPRRYDRYDDYGSDLDYDHGSTRMVIHSRHLRNAISAVVGYFPDLDLTRDQLVITAPYQVLVHHMKDLELYKMNQPGTHDEEYAATTAKHIDIVISFLKKTLGQQIEEEERRWTNSTPTATYDLLWLLMKPGEVIYKKHRGFWAPFVVSRVVQSRQNGQRESYVVEVWTIRSFDGIMQREMEDLYIDRFNGEQPINSLPAIPARFYGGGKAAAEKQIKLGKLYWELCKKPAYRDYDGPILGRDDNPSQLTARVVVDVEGYNSSIQRHKTPRYIQPVEVRKRNPDRLPPPRDHLPQIKPQCPCVSCRVLRSRPEMGPFAGFEDLDPNKDAPPENDLFFQAMSDMIPAFVLRERRWVMVKVEELSEVKPDREAFKHLVLDEETKLTVKALAGKFASADGQVSPWSSDIIKNKGEGRIFLLHGSPGVGKTCTAECVAELANRPLLPLTSGDLGTSMSSRSLERNLNYFLNLGERYGALVLLDEADVYLEERRPSDLNRNGLVSVFLRALEYYKGVLILTTNRVEAFNVAFTSRIHVALHYPELTDADRVRVWENNFERLERDGVGNGNGLRCLVLQSTRDFAYTSEEVRCLRLNGREIRNALQTAVALAETDAVEVGQATITLSERHLRAVVRMSGGFKEFLRQQKRLLRGGDDDGEDGGEEEEEDSETDDDRSASSMGF